MSYVALIILTALIILFMYVSHIKNVNKDLRRQKQNLQTKIVQEKVKSNIKEFQAYQKAKKEQIKKDMKKGKDESQSDINLSVGTHDIGF